MHSVG